MGLAIGMISAGHAIGGAAGAFLGGYLFDLYDCCDWGWVRPLALAGLAGLLAFLLPDAPPPAIRAAGS